MSLQQSSCKMHFVTVHSMYGLLSPIARFLSSLADRGMHHNYSRTYFSRGDFKIGVTAPSPLENLYRVTHMVAENIMLTSNSKFRLRPG